MTYFLKCVGDEILGLACLAVVVFIVGGLGFLIWSDMSRTEMKFNTCIAAGMKWVEGDCTK